MHILNPAILEDGGGGDGHKEEEEDDDLNNDVFLYTRSMRDFVSFPARKTMKESEEIKIVVKDYVLPFLPAKTLIRFRAVSKEWDQWIMSPFLAHQQSYFFQQLSGFFCQCVETDPTFVTLDNHAYGVPTPSLSFLPELVNISSSSNGLLLCRGQTENNCYYVCNPAKNEWKKLPEPEYYQIYHGSEPAIVLGFEPSVLNMDARYHLICAVPLFDQSIVCFEMYSSRTRSWRSSDVICFELGEDLIVRDSGLYMKGTAYWETSSRKVLAFNPTKEIHGIMTLPPECPHGGILTQMYDELCYIGMINHNGNECYIEIYGGVEFSLKHKLRVHFEVALLGHRVLSCVEGNVVMILNGGFLHSYNLSDQKLELIRKVSTQHGDRYLPYVNSLVSVA